MTMKNLTHASRQLFSRPPDERFDTLPDLHRHCLAIKERSQTVREPSAAFRPLALDAQLMLRINGLPPCRMNDWSFTQLCRFASAGKDTVNRLRADTAAQALAELLEQRPVPRGDLHALTLNSTALRAVTSDRYTRLWNADLVAMLMEFATDFTPPPKGKNGGTGIYAGEQDAFVFNVDATCWITIGDEVFAPGFFVWNSEVGRRTIGVSTFWFQRLCANHLIWDATEVLELTRRHVGKVRESLNEIRSLIEMLVRKRDDRKDAFATVIRKAMQTSCGQDAEEVEQLLRKKGFTRMLAKLAVNIAQEKGSFSLWTIVDALTQLTGAYKYAGERVETDMRASALLGLVGT